MRVVLCPSLLAKADRIALHAQVLVDAKVQSISRDANLARDSMQICEMRIPEPSTDLA